MSKFLKKFLILGLASIAVSGAARADVKFKKMEPATSFSITLVESMAKANQDRLFLVSLGAEWCGYCKRQKENLAKWPADSKTKLGTTVWREIDIDAVDTNGLKAELKTLKATFDGGVPTTYFVANGLIIAQAAGAMGMAELDKLLVQLETKLKELRAKGTPVQ